MKINITFKDVRQSDANLLMILANLLTNGNIHAQDYSFLFSEICIRADEDKIKQAMDNLEEWKERDFINLTSEIALKAIAKDMGIEVNE